MTRKWSNIIKPRDETVAVADMQMVELSKPPSRRLNGPGHGRNEQADQSEPSHDCSLLQQQAYEAGREAGIEEGKGQLMAEIEAERLLLSDLITQVGDAKSSAIQRAEDDIVTLTLGIAKKVIHREATVDREIVATQVRQALQYFSTKMGVRVKAHPDEVSRLETLCSTLIVRPDDPPPFTVEEDQTIQRGGCLIESDSIYIDATIDRQLEVIQASLSHESRADEIDRPSSTS